MITAALVGIFGVAGALLRFGVDSWFAHHSSIRTAGNGGDSRHKPHSSRGKAGQSSGRSSGHTARLHWPWATLVVNVAGCFIIGISHAMSMRLGLPSEWQAGLATGLAGGLTTFSSWTTATVRLLAEARLGSAVLNVAANLVLGLAAAAAGIALAS